jgi:hypothetical protein
MENEYISINGELYQKVDTNKTWYSCPFCNSLNLTKESDDEVSYGRTGCLDCDKWFGGKQMKRAET